MASTFVDVYALALKALDHAAWEFFCELEDRILYSAACLLKNLELVALRPAVGYSSAAAAAVSPSSASYMKPAQGSSGTSTAGATGGEAWVAAGILRYVRESLQASVFHPHQTKVDSSTASAPARLAKDISRVREHLSFEQSSLSSAPLPTLVLTELSAVCQGVLVLSALWLSTKFWATISESSILSGLIAWFLRLSLPSSNERTAAGSFSEGSALKPTSNDKLRSCRGSTTAAVPIKQVDTETLCCASTPPSSSPVHLESGWCTGVPDARVELASGREGSAACLVCEHVVSDYEIRSCDPLAHLTWLDGGIAEAAEWLASDVEDTEMILLRCSDYTIPL
ncbi:hypothetical protein JKF63_07054 [Porcisia hertigi]|uniref:Uncharacterized protein n=1 Tax=Porcisia hertigi TaxID=2761500 RepID=A0A836LJ16_9TRYP|nr:hypothetical protein JKF63_07054 [Porcisia hertigi]